MNRLFRTTSSLLKCSTNCRYSLFKNAFSLVASRSQNFCTSSPQTIKNSIRLGNDAQAGQSIQSTLQEDFDQIESISNPSHQSSSQKKIISDFYLKEDNITIDKLAEFTSIDSNSLSQKLSSMGINPDKISIKEANMISLEYDVKIMHVSEKKLQCPRSPVVTIMGHVDHGKTTLLDFLRNSQIAKGEFGGITQKIGAFHVITPENQRITFIDTPGHEAFSNMRVRGANSTDIIILVVSAIEGIQPQTLEVIKLAHSNSVPIIVAINKIDVQGARPDQIERQLKEVGKLEIEPFGGNIPVIHVSAKNGTNMDLLQELILFEAELMELKEEFDTLAEGIVLESRRDNDTDEKSCTIIVQKGTLKVGDSVVIGNNFCKIRSIKDDKKAILKSALPSYAVEITGIKELPQSGDVIFAVENESKAKILSQRRTKNEEDLETQEEQFIEGSGSKLKFATRKEKRQFFSGNREFIEKKYSEVETRIIESISELEERMEIVNNEVDKRDLSKQIAKLKQDLQQNKTYMANLVGSMNVGSSINLIIKANDFGTKETLISQILKAKLEYPDVKLNIISATVGPVNETDIRDAELFGAKILGMEIQLAREIESQIKQKQISIKSHRIIYTLIDDIKQLLEEGPEEQEVQEKEEERGQATILNVIEIKASKTQKQLVAGCKVLSGKISKKFLFRVERDGEIIESDLEVANLRHFKKEVEEIKEGNECGIIFFKYNEFEEGDTLIAYERI